MRSIVVGCLLVCACEREPDSLTIDLTAAVDDTGHGVVEVTLAVSQISSLGLKTDAPGLMVEVAIDAPDSVSSQISGELDGDALAGTRWLRPRPVTDRLNIELTGHGRATIQAWARGPVIAPIAIDRSLKWRDDAVLETPTIAGLAHVMATIAEDGHGGALLDHWLRSFATTPHSQRPGPALLMDEIAATQGPDPTTWRLDALPFRVTAVHNRIDLARRSPDTCGQVRITVASIHEVHAPLHLIFLFAQPPRTDDIAPDGTVHCLGTNRAWSRLSALSDDEFADAANDWLAGYVRSERFLLAESLERASSSPDDEWEWRQWVPAQNPDPSGALDTILINPPLFQTVDVEAVNQDGALRDRFLAFVEQNAQALNDRAALIPDEFAPRATRLSRVVARPALDLTGLPPAVLTQFPDLADQIEIVGCPACHTTPSSEFVHTYEGRFESDFQFHELEARAELVDALNLGTQVDYPLYGPVQPFINFSTPL